MAGLLAATAAFAHHGWGGYDREIREPMTVTRIKWGNPHDLVWATGADGTEWTLVVGPPARNRKFGFGPGMVDVGDTVDVLGAGHPRKPEAKVHVISRDGEEVYRYYYSANQDSQERLGGTVPQQRRSDR